MQRLRGHARFNISTTHEKGKYGASSANLYGTKQFSLDGTSFSGEPCDGTAVVKKKAQTLADFKSSITPATPDTVLEVDEVFTFVFLKVKQIRIWIAQSRQTRQIISFFIGDGSMASCKRLWRKLPYEYLRCTSFSDFRRSYNCIPAETHQKVDKKSGETAHIERLNNTIRQRFSRLVRKTLSFSKREYMLNLHFKLWAFQYNLNPQSF